MISKYILAILGVLFGAQQVLACGEIVPNKVITLTVKRLAYKDFPKAADIFAEIRIESSYRPNVINKNGREDSRGLMQVAKGPMDPRENITIGISLLREYYMITHSKEGAIKAYNIGIGNYLKGKLKVSGAEYYAKFLLQRRVYANYAKTGKLHYLGPNLGCGKLNHVVLDKAVARSASSSVQSYHWETSLDTNTGGIVQTNATEYAKKVHNGMVMKGEHNASLLLRGSFWADTAISARDRKSVV